MQDSSISDIIFANRWKALTVVSVIQFILLLDATVVNVALPNIKQDLGFTDSSLTWVVNAYLVVAGSLLLLGGRIGDAFGLRRILLLGVSVFGVFSLLATFSPNAIFLIAGRAGQGIGEALAGSTALGMVSLLFPSGPERNKAFSIWAALGGLGSIVGVLLSGVITEYLSWRWIFGINIPITIVLSIAVLIYVPKISKQTSTRLDISNALILAISVSVIVIGIIGSGIQTIYWLRIVLTLLGLFGVLEVVLRCKKRKDGIIPSRLITRSPRITGYIIVAILASASGAIFYLGVLLLQENLGMSPMQSGLAWLPFCLGFFPGLFLFQYITNKWSIKAAAMIGLSISSLGFLMFALGIPQLEYWSRVMPAMLVTSIGFGCVAPVAQSLATSGLSEEDSGAGSGITSTIQQLFQVGGVTLFVAIALASSNQANSSNVIEPVGFMVAFSLIAIVLISGTVLIGVKGAVLNSTLEPTEKNNIPDN